MLFTKRTGKSVEEAGQALEKAAAGHKFGVLAIHNLKETMAKKGVEFASPCLIYEVCNPHQAKIVLEANGAISTALPCRISVYRAGEVFKIATILPTAMLGMFNNPELEPVAREVEDIVVAMMKETA